MKGQPQKAQGDSVSAVKVRQENEKGRKFIWSGIGTAQREVRRESNGYATKYKCEKQGTFW